MFIIAKTEACLEKMHIENVGNLVLQKYSPYNILIVFFIRLGLLFLCKRTLQNVVFHLEFFLLLGRSQELLDKFFSNSLSNSLFLYLILTSHKFTACMKARHKHELKSFNQ